MENNNTTGNTSASATSGQISPETIKPGADSKISPAKKRERKLGYVIAVLAILFAAGFAAYKFSPGLSNLIQAKQDQHMVVLDTRKLLAASTKQIMSKNLSNEQIAAVSQKLALNMQKLVSSYRDQGYVIMNSSAFITFPPSMDITAQFADQLGVTLE